jgi:AmmeMemoRadiSam system protein B
MRLAFPDRVLPVAAAAPLGAAALALIAFAFLFLPSDGEEGELAAIVPSGPAHPITFFDERTFALAVARVEATAPNPMAGVRALTVPHHWLAGHLILGGLRDLAASGDYRRIILMGPNHTNAGGAAVITSDLPWQTPFGLVEPDSAALGQLTDIGFVRSEPDVLTYEHSIAGIVPAIAYYLPEAQVVPLALRSDLTPAEVERLAAALAPLLDSRTVILAAVDFSHYLSAEEARQRDRETLAALQSLDFKGILSFGDEHLDSPASIAVLMESMRLLGATRFELRENSNSSELGGPVRGPVTSYVNGYYH